MEHNLCPLQLTDNVRVYLPDVTASEVLLCKVWGLLCGDYEVLLSMNEISKDVYKYATFLRETDVHVIV